MRRAWLTASILAASLITAGAASAQDAAAKPEKEKLICRADKATGSRVKVRKVCLTRAEWDELSLDKNDRMRAYQSGGRVAASSNPMAGAGSPF